MSDFRLRRPVVAALGGLAVALATSSPVLADNALDLWAQGKYEEAITSGLADRSAEGLSAAARAATTELTLRATPCLQCAQRAEDISRKALAADPKAAVPSFCLAAALAYHGRIIGTINLEGASIGSEARKTIEEAMAAHPNDARLISAMAIWNFEVVRVAGSMLSRIVYGATMERGLSLYDRAFKLSPNDMLITYQYGLSLAAYDTDAYRPKIEAAWARVAAAHPQNSYDEEIKGRAAKLLALLKSGDEGLLGKAVKSEMGIPG